MSMPTEPSPEELLVAARSGDSESLGRLLQLYWNYLKLLASTRIDERLQARFSASDVVQEACLDAHRGFAQFRGETERELRAWLRQILINRLWQLVQQHARADKRNVHCEVSLNGIGAAIGRSTARLESILAASITSPSAGASRREHTVILADSIARLPEDYREVLVLRHLEGLPFEQVAGRMGRSSGAVRMLWMRALEQLRQLLKAEGLS